MSYTETYTILLHEDNSSKDHKWLKTYFKLENGAVCLYIHDFVGDEEIEHWYKLSFKDSAIFMTKGQIDYKDSKQAEIDLKKLLVKDAENIILRFEELCKEWGLEINFMAWRS